MSGSRKDIKDATLGPELHFYAVDFGIAALDVNRFLLPTSINCRSCSLLSRLRQCRERKTRNLADCELPINIAALFLKHFDDFDGIGRVPEFPLQFQSFERQASEHSQIAENSVSERKII